MSKVPLLCFTTLVRPKNLSTSFARLSSAASGTNQSINQKKISTFHCLFHRKHIIAPSTRFTSKKHPLTLVAWLCRRDLNLQTKSFLPHKSTHAKNICSDWPWQQSTRKRWETIMTEINIYMNIYEYEYIVDDHALYLWWYQLLPLIMTMVSPTWLDLTWQAPAWLEQVGWANFPCQTPSEAVNLAKFPDLLAPKLTWKVLRLASSPPDLSGLVGNLPSSQVPSSQVRWLTWQSSQLMLMT